MIGAGGFPAPIAAAIQAWEAEDETDLFRRQARLLACFEALVQYSAIVAVSEFHRAGLDRELPDVDALIREVIHRPSTGTWQRIYREAAGAFKTRRNALVCDALYRFGFDDAGRQQPRMRAADKLTQLRNEQKGHGHVLADVAEYRAIIEEHEGHLRELLRAAEFARELTLCVVIERSGRGVIAGRLMGPVESAAPRDEFPPADDAPPPGHVGARHAATGAWIDLSPLLLYLECEREVERIDERGNRTRERCGRPGVFFHHELVPPSRIRGFEYRYAHHSSWRFPDFDFVGIYLERYGRRAGAATEAEWYQARIAEATRFFVGREEPLRQLTAVANGAPRRVAFVKAGPGLGKSTLLARWIARMEEPSTVRSVEVCRHFIQDQYPESGRASNVFDILRHQVCARFGLDPTPPYPDGRSRADRYRSSLLEALRVAVRGPDKPLITLVIDGLDEAMRVTPGEDEALLDWIPGPDLLPAGVSLVLSGRPSVETHPVFLARFGRAVAEYIELTHLEDDEVQAWFALAFGPAFTLEHGAFLERVAAQAEGHPQYLHFVQRALMDGSLQPGDADRLPAELKDFYSRVMADAAGEQPAALRVIALLAATTAPLDLGTLAVILGESPEATARSCDAARNVLEWDPGGQVFLFDAAFAEWVRAGEIRAPADALRREIHATMAARLLDWCRDWRRHRNAYAASNLVGHLVAAGRHDEVAELARDAEFPGFQAGARPDAPDLPQATFRAALHQAAASGDYGATAEFGLRRAAWVTTVLAESPLDALLTGSSDRARRLADLLDPVHRLTWYFRLAAEMLRREGPDAAQSFLGLPGRLPWWTPASAPSPVDLTQAADALVALRALPGFTALRRLYLDPEAQCRLARGLVLEDQIELALEIMRETPPGAHRDQALIQLAERAAAAGDFAGAYGYVKDMWLRDSRWLARDLITEAGGSSPGLEVLDIALQESAGNPIVRDPLVQRLATTFAKAGKFEEAGIAARNVENPGTRDQALDGIGRVALERGRPDVAARFIQEMTPASPHRRPALDRAGIAALRLGHLKDLGQVLGADRAWRPLVQALVALTAAVGGGMTLAAAVSGWSRLAPWGPVAWLVLALAITIGFRSGTWRAGLAALIWGGLMAWSFQAVGNGGPLAVSGALVAGGAALLAAVVWFGLDRLSTSLAARSSAMAAAALLTAGVLTALAGPRLVALTLGSTGIAFALLLPAGAAFAASALAPLTSAEERLSYHGVAILPAVVLFFLGEPMAAGMPLLLVSGWAVAGMSSVARPVLARVGLPGRRALWLAWAETFRGVIALPDLDPAARVQDFTSGLISLVIIIIVVAVLRRRGEAPEPTAEHPGSTNAGRTRPSLAELRNNPAQRSARHRAELLLRLVRLFPAKTGRPAWAACREAAKAAASLSSPAAGSGGADQPVRRDLLWQIARESRHRGDMIGAARAAWWVEWRWWSGALAAAGAVATAGVLALMIRWMVGLNFPGATPTFYWAAIGTGSIVAAMVATPRLRTLREPLMAIPLGVLVASTLTWGAGLTLLVPVPLVFVLLVAIGATRSGDPGSWLAALALLVRRQVLIAVPIAMLAAAALGAAEQVLGIVLAPTLVLGFLGFYSRALDTDLHRAAKRVLPRAGADLPALDPASPRDQALIEHGIFPDEVGTAIVRLAEREPNALPGITRAAMAVQ